MEDAEVMDVVRMLLTVTTSQTRICIRITWVWTSMQVDTVERMMGDMLEGAVVVMARGIVSQSSVSDILICTHRTLLAPSYVNDISSSPG